MIWLYECHWIYRKFTSCISVRLKFFMPLRILLPMKILDGLLIDLGLYFYKDPLPSLRTTNWFLKLHSMLFLQIQMSGNQKLVLLIKSTCFLLHCLRDLKVTFSLLQRITLLGYSNGFFLSNFNQKTNIF